MKNPALNRLVGFTLQRLPDSLAERKALLADVLSVLHPKHPLRIQVVELLTALDLHERHQLSLALDFKKELSNG